MKKNTWSVKDYLHIGFMGFPKGGLCGIDVTYRCNLKCAHCYFRTQGYKDELSLNGWMEKFISLESKGFPFLICGWLGGEPLLRPEVIELGRKFFKSNVIFTNGTQALPQWHDCKFIISVPGTKKLYQEITGTNRLTYERVKENANRSDLNVIVSYCITRSNIHAIDEFIDEWRRDTSIKGIFFEFYTPVKGHEDNLWVDWKERDIILDKLLDKKKEYGDFIYNTNLMLKLMKSKQLKRILLNCPFHEIGLSLDPMGNIKLPCTLGQDADCTRCGCILPIFAYILSHKRYLVTSFAEGVAKEIEEHLLNHSHFNKKEVRYENTTHSP